MRPVRPVLMVLLLCLGTFLLPSCSGDGTSGTDPNGSITLSSLILPDNVSVVDPQTQPSSSPSAKSIKSLLFGITLLDLDPASDYRTDRTTVYVNERSLDSFRTVNEILCMVRQSRYDIMVNQGPYRAQVDKNLCSTNRSDASNAGQATTDQSSGSTMPLYEDWIVESVRTNAQAPHIVNVWIHPTPGPYDPPQVIDARIVIAEGANTAPPYGIFTMNFKALDPGRSGILFKGFLNAEHDAALDRAVLKFSTEDKDSYVIEKATLDKDPAGANGTGSVLKVESFPGQTPKTNRFDLAYNSTNFLRSDISGTQICLDRVNFNNSAWRYGLYSTVSSTAGPVGSRVTRNSNFTVKKVNPDLYGSIGYWGAWFPGDAAVADGEQVYKHDYSTNTDTPFTVFSRGGKLKKYTKDVITLADIKNIPLISFSSGTTQMVGWDGFQFWVVAEQSISDGLWSSITPTPFDLGNLPWVDLMFWSQSLSGSVIVKLPPPTAAALPSECINNGNGTFSCTGKATGATEVVYFKEQLIFPGDAIPAQLACFERCPDATALSTANPFRTDILSYQSVTPTLASYASYSFSATTMLLTDSISSDPVTASTTTSPYENGITSGLLFDPSPANLSALACDWNAGATCAGKAWSALPEFFVWETGPNTWNQFVTVRDGAGTPVKFDPPLQVKYIHSQPTITAPDHKYDGVMFFLEYSGFGDLHGIPGMCVNVDTGLANVDCSEGSTNQAIRWVPEFSIPFKQANNDLTTVTDVGNPSISYFVKALEVEERMGSALLSACSGLSTSPYTLPSMSSWIDPVIGPEPVITAPPAVVGGVVQ